MTALNYMYSIDICTHSKLASLWCDNYIHKIKHLHMVPTKPTKHSIYFSSMECFKIDLPIHVVTPLGFLTDEPSFACF